MDVAAVVMIHCSLNELRSRKPFVIAAEYTKWPVTVHITCDSTGQDLQTSCTPPAMPGTHCWGWRYFQAEWERKHGRI